MDNQQDLSGQGTLSHSPLLIVISGPSGVGKDAVVSCMRNQKLPYHFVVTATTRSKRPGEKDKRDYHFLSPEKFQVKLKEGAFLEHAEVYGNLYGVPRSEIVAAFHQGNDVILKTDVQGAATLKNLVPEAVFIFLRATSFKELEERLKARHTETQESIESRLHTARSEMEEAWMFDHVVINKTGYIEEATKQINEIISAEHQRAIPRVVKL